VKKTKKITTQQLAAFFGVKVDTIYQAKRNKGAFRGIIPTKKANGRCLWPVEAEEYNLVAPLSSRIAKLESTIENSLKWVIATTTAIKKDHAELKSSMTQLMSQQDEQRRVTRNNIDELVEKQRVARIHINDHNRMGADLSVATEKTFAAIIKRLNEIDTRVARIYDSRVGLV